MRIWIDVDNAPHVAFFRPIVAELRASGAEVEVTARGRTFVPEMLQAAGIEHEVIGRGQPQGLFGKATAVAGRALLLAKWARGRRFDVAVGHGSRSIPFAARALGVPNLTTYDYEHVNARVFTHLCDRIVVPKVVHDGLSGVGEKWGFYNGFKEEIYLDAIPSDPTFREKLGISPGATLVVVRPPSRTAHYHDRRSEQIERAILDRFAEAADAAVIWLRRDPGDPVPTGANIFAPDQPLDGVSLLAAADVVISGGGTMIREAALLGAPAYSIFMGPIGAVDAELIRRGWLTVIRNPADVDQILLKRKSPDSKPRLRASVRGELIAHIMQTARPGAAAAEEVPCQSPSSI